MPLLVSHAEYDPVPFEKQVLQLRDALCKSARGSQCIDRFAFTSNNVSYAAAGDALNYWAFFPAPEGWV